MKKVAVILSGCGVFDGSEIHEACAALLALHRAEAEVVICAPTGPQLHVVDHVAGEPAEGETRDILVESARLARGDIRPLAEVEIADLDAVLLPGGFGAAKNLCTFAVDGENCTVHPEVESFLRRAHGQGKAIGAMCIAPVILAKVFGADLKPAVTIGNDPVTAGKIKQMGARHIDCAADETVVDEGNNLVTTPAYMIAGDIGEVFDGAAACVEKLLGLCR
ncbi:MAG: isoprenoid biosynthesis glyoxalase ElbB [Candidatus Krumholzibacteriota bacterium]